MTKYIVIYTAITANDNNHEETHKDLPAEIFYADDDEMAQEIAIRKRQILDVIFSSVPTLGFKKEVIIKGIRDQTNKRTIYPIRYSSDCE